MTKNIYEKILLDHLIDDKNIKATSREAAILSSLDESPITKFNAKETKAIEEEKIEESVVEEPKQVADIEEPVKEEKQEFIATEEKASEPIVDEKIAEESFSDNINPVTIAINDSLNDGKRPQEETSTKKTDSSSESLLDKKTVIALNDLNTIEEAKEENSKENTEEKEQEENSPTLDDGKEEKTAETSDSTTEDEQALKDKMKIRGSITENVGESGTTKVPGKFEVFPEDDQFKYRLKANNGEILVVSYGYTTRNGAHAGIDTLKKNLEEGIVSYITDKNGHSQWRLSTSNDSRIVALGETYAALARAQSAFASTQKFGKTENIIDLDEIPASERREWDFVCEVADEKDSGVIEIYDDGGKFRARLKANNQEVLFVTSQSYSSKTSLKSALDNIKSKMNPNAFQLSKDKQGRYQFIMESGSGFVYLVGETYSTAQSAKSAASSVLAFIQKATINDLTLKSSTVEVELTGVKK